MLFAQQILHPSAFSFFSIRAILASAQGVTSPPNGETVELHSCAACKKLWQNVSKAACILETTAYLVTRLALIFPACHTERLTFKSELCQPL